MEIDSNGQVEPLACRQEQIRQQSETNQSLQAQVAALQRGRWKRGPIRRSAERKTIRRTFRWGSTPIPPVAPVLQYKHFQILFGEKAMLLKNVLKSLAACLAVSVWMGSGSLLVAAGDPAVRVWEEKAVIPTYLAGPPEPNPMFFFGRASQGAQGPVYPYPMYDSLTGKKVDKTYTLVHIENEYIRLGILPEIGGRIFEGLDKTNNYNFIYRQHVIKPALIGLIGAWISGGVEWNIPHHHRASTFIPVQYRVEENPDGSKTVWVGELEVRQRMRWAVGYTLRPGKAYFEASVRILNRTPVENTMLCFANVAVHANDNYQVIFPPSTQYGTGHGKRTFTQWPISDTIRGGPDNSNDIDISWYKNHINSNSVFAWNYSDDFVAGYDHGKEAGTMSVTDHNIIPGKKFFTWGNGPSGKRWDHVLTDDDGPYLEIMVGAYSDNQPDYSWLQPYETRSFSMNWYPFREIGGVKKANLDAAVNLDVVNGAAKMGFYTTSAHTAAKVLLKAGQKTLWQETIAINPGKPYLKQLPLPAGVDEHDLVASISDGGRELVSYSPVRLQPQPPPPPVTTPPAPADVKTSEELYLIGLRAEQFHDPNLDPEPYWQEALRRDPGDVRVNTVLGIARYRKARYEEAERYLRTALARATDRYTQPKDGEAVYYLGAVLKAEGRDDEAFTQFYKATWSQAWKAAGYYSLAEIAAARGNMAAALDFVDRSIDSNALNIRAQNLKAAVLRHLDRGPEALQALAAAHRADPLDVRSMAERWLTSKTPAAAKALGSTMNDHPATAQETAAEYLDAGLWQDGTDALLQMTAAAPDKSKVHPMAYYYLGYFAEKLGQAQKASEYYKLASAAAAGIRLSVPERGHRRAARRHPRQRPRLPRAVLPGRPALRLAAGGGHQVVGVFRDDRPVVRHHAPQPGGGLHAPQAGGGLGESSRRAGEGRGAGPQVRPAFHRAGRALRAGRHAD